MSKSFFIIKTNLKTKPIKQVKSLYTKVPVGKSDEFHKTIKKVNNLKKHKIKKKNPIQIPTKIS